MANWQVISLDTTTPQLRAPGTGDGYSFNSGSTQLGVWTTTGLGIGTASPSSKLHLSGAATADARLTFTQTTAGLSSQIQQGSSGMAIAALGSQSMLFETGGTTRATLDSSGNLGLGVTPSAWSIKALQVNTSSIASDSNDTYIQSNAFFDGSWKYISSAEAAQYYQVNGSHVWRSAPSGTAGNAITFTQAMTLTAAGDLGVGTTNPQAKLHVAAGNILIDNSRGISAFDNAGTQETLLTISTANNVNVSAPTLSGSIDFNIRNSTGSHRFFSGGSERARIDSSGRLLVGGTSAQGSSTAGSVDIQNTGSNLFAATRFISGSSGPFLALQKSRSDTVGTNTIVADGDTLGTIMFGGANGTGYSDAAFIRGQVDGTPGASNDMPGRLVFATSADGSGSPTERMRISNAGNVVVNTAAVATTATDGFLYIPTCAGAPTGVPTTFTGRSPLVVDSTNNRFYVYVNGAWKYATLT